MSSQRASSQDQKSLRFERLEIRRALAADMQTPFGGVAAEIEDGAVIQAENFDEDGPGIAYSDTTTRNRGGLYRNTEVDITTDGADGFRVGWTADGEFLEYTVDATAGEYDLSLRAFAGSGSAGDVRVLIGDGETFSELTTIDVTPTGSWSSADIFTSSAPVTIAGGTQVLRLEIVGKLLDIDWLRFDATGPVVNDPPEVTIDSATPQASTGGGSGDAYQEEGGLVVFEVESTPTVPDWELQTSVNGYTGSGYYRWEGPNFFRDPGNGVLAYKINITNPGTYQMRLHNHRDKGTADLENDVFARMDDGDWEKVFTIEKGVWNWTSRFDLSHSNRPPAFYELDAGEHTFYLSGRSTGFRLDRVVLFNTDFVNQTQATRLTNPVSDTGGGGGTADPLTFNLAATIDDDGRLAPYTLQWSLESGPGTANFQNDNAEDTSVTFSTPGTYVVKLTANDGEFETSDTFTITTPGASNAAPVVNAGPNQSITLPTDTVSLDGTVSDDGQPAALTTEWFQVSGPGTVTFGDASQVDTTATFPGPGTYVLRLSADDGAETTTDSLTVTVSDEPTSGGGDTVVIDAIGDAYLQDGRRFNNSHLRVESGGRERTVYLQFDVAGLTGLDVTSAKLVLTESNTTSADIDLVLHEADSNNWAENTITGANAPGQAALLDTYSGPVADGQVVEFDVTPAIAGDGLVSFILTTSDNRNRVWFGSTESSTVPQLVLSVQPTAAAPLTFAFATTSETPDGEPPASDPVADPTDVSDLALLLLETPTSDPDEEVLSPQPLIPPTATRRP